TSSTIGEAGRTAFIIGMVFGLVAGASAAVFAIPRTPSTPDDGGGGVGEVTFTLKAFITGYVGVGGSIDGVKNPELKVAKGDKVTINVENGEDLIHDLTIDEVQAKAAVAKKGDKAVAVFTAGTEGTFAYYCSVPGHRSAGMEGKLVVGSGTGGGGGGPGPIGPAKAVDTPWIARDPADVPPPTGRNNSTTVHIYMEVKEVIAEIEPGTTLQYWTYNGTVPGPFFRVRVGDTVVVHFKNSGTSTMTHSVDFHAVTGPGGGAASTQTGPGNSTSFQFKAMNPGIYVYHCASPHIPSHISLGMYGLILVEPAAGLPAVDKEFYVMQGDIYTKWKPGTKGHQEHDSDRMFEESPTYVVFNGCFKCMVGDHALKASVNQTVRIYFGVGGPNLVSSFHVIGEIFDKVYPEGALENPVMNLQTTLVPTGGASVVEMRLDFPANFILVDHSLTRSIDKGSIAILAVDGWADPGIYKPIKAGHAGDHGMEVPVAPGSGRR
ncbi:MAG TPA: copper-containing nitrite reductase, partial [Thermoplasmata archaeon]|nr:copper-containing nitrite reductase [Thermoplasmata archaeon]